MLDLSDSSSSLLLLVEFVMNRLTILKVTNTNDVLVLLVVNLLPDLNSSLELPVNHALVRENFKGWSVLLSVKKVEHSFASIGLFVFSESRNLSLVEGLASPGVCDLELVILSLEITFSLLATVGKHSVVSCSCFEQNLSLSVGDATNGLTLEMFSIEVDLFHSSGEHLFEMWICWVQSGQITVVHNQIKDFLEDLILVTDPSEALRIQLRLEVFLLDRISRNQLCLSWAQTSTEAVLLPLVSIRAARVSHGN